MHGGVHDLHARVYTQVIHMHAIGYVHDMHTNLYWHTRKNVHPNFQFFKPCVWVGAPSCYLELLNKLQKWICRTVGPSLAPSLEPLAHQNAVSLSLFYSTGIILVDVHMN